MEEDIEVLNNFIKYFFKNKKGGNKANLLVLGEEIKAIENVLNELEKQEDRITELEKALIDLDWRHKKEKDDLICKLQNDIIRHNAYIENYKIIGLEEKLNPFTALRQYAREILEELGGQNGRCKNR